MSTPNPSTCEEVDGSSSVVCQFDGGESNVTLSPANNGNTYVDTDKSDTGDYWFPNSGTNQFLVSAGWKPQASWFPLPDKEIRTLSCEEEPPAPKEVSLGTLEWEMSATAQCSVTFTWKEHGAITTSFQSDTGCQQIPVRKGSTEVIARYAWEAVPRYEQGCEEYTIYGLRRCYYS